MGVNKQLMFIFVRSMSLKFLQLISEQSEQKLDPQQRNYNMKTLYLSDIMEFLLGNHSKERNKKDITDLYFIQ